jgi:hypothetical protein
MWDRFVLFPSSSNRVGPSFPCVCPYSSPVDGMVGAGYVDTSYSFCLLVLAAGRAFVFFFETDGLSF